MSVLAALICPRCADEPSYGVEIRGLYDGVLYWVCPAGHKWPRFNAPHRLNGVAVAHLRTVAAAVEHERGTNGRR